MENTKTRSPFLLGHALNLGDPQVIGIVVAVFTVLITIGKVIYICVGVLYVALLTYGTVIEHNL
jgi:threonine/homoserine/homoserine lactone efflux protein